MKYQESALGCWIETVGDYSYYLAIFAGLTSGRCVKLDGKVLLARRHRARRALFCFALLIYLRSRITAGQPEKLHAVARTRFNASGSTWSELVWRISFVATRSAMPYGIMALALINALPAVVILAAIGANIYWLSLTIKLRHLLADNIRKSVNVEALSLQTLKHRAPQQLPAAPPSPLHGDLVGVLEVAADGHAHRDARHADAERLEQLRQVDAPSLPLRRWDWSRGSLPRCRRRRRASADP